MRMGQGVRTGLGHGGITCVLQTQFSSFVFFLYGNKISGPGCSKLTTSLVNVSLKFQMLIIQICHYFLSKKIEKLLQCKSFSNFFNKKFSVFGYKVVKHLTS